MQRNHRGRARFHGTLPPCGVGLSGIAGSCRMTIALILAGAYGGVLVAAVAWQFIAWAARIAVTRFRGRSVQQQTEPESAPHVVVTLVHGTWARRADWTMPSSPLCRSVCRAARGPVRFERLVWSGWNTVTSRSKAVERLISHLADLQKRWPQARHFVVGHSHGGNIAFQAMRDEAVEARIAGVVCLSTPFLWASPRDLGPVGRIALWWFPVVIALVCLVPAVELLPLALQDAAGAIALIIAVGLGLVFSPWATKFAKVVAGALQYPDVQPRKVLIVRSFGDEASAALGAAHMISWIAELLWSSTSRFLGALISTVETWRAALAKRWRLLVPACVVLAGLAIVSLATAERGSWLARGGYVAEFFGALLIAVLAAPSFLVIVALGIVTGPELLVAALLFRVTPESTPPGGGWTVWQVPKDPWNTPHGAVLMHSTTYDDEESLAIVSQWMLGRS
jgi:pimeloyl-ACP methyl ester carboxylesterase